MIQPLHRIFFSICVILIISASVAAEDNRDAIPANAVFDLLQKKSKEHTYRQVLTEAGTKLGARRFYFAGNWVNGERLVKIAALRQNEPLLRTIREELRQPVDLHDFCLFLDDLLLAYTKKQIAVVPYLPPGRARSAGILLHPDDVYGKKPRRYGIRKDILYINQPKRQANLTPAENGDPLGPRWTVRFRNPATQEARMEALRKQAPDATFVPRLEHLLQQFKRQGATVIVTSTVRSRKRGYLMWGSFALGRCTRKPEADRLVKRLQKLNTKRNLNIPIQWEHPDGWRATVAAARDMAESYDVVYATERGAFYSNHYDGTAVDMVIRALPRVVRLESPSGTIRIFHLDDPSQPRDVSLTPEIVDWIEKHYKLDKLRSDYPHWDNRR